MHENKRYPYTSRKPAWSSSSHGQIQHVTKNLQLTKKPISPKNNPNSSYIYITLYITHLIQTRQKYPKK